MKTNELTPTPRERVSVAITGIDRSTPDVIVEDGKCEKLHNARYSGGAWRPTHRYMLKHSLPDSLSEYTIVYHHSAAGDNTYIAVDTTTGEYHSLTFNGVAEPTLKSIATIRDVTSISHFGNILIFKTRDAVTYYMLKGGEYMPFVIPPHMLTSASSKMVSSVKPSCFYVPSSTQGTNGKWVDAEDVSSGDQSKVTASWFPIYNISQDIPMIHTEDDSWHGDLLLFTTWRMADGTNISPSPLHLIKSYSGINDRHTYKTTVGTGPSPLEKSEKIADKYLGLTKTASGGTHSYNDLLSANLLCSAISSVRVSFPASLDISAIHSIAIWATRPYPVFSANNITSQQSTQRKDDNFRPSGGVNVSSASSFISFYDDTNIANEPFYLLKEFELSEVAIEGDIKYVSIDITNSLLQSAINNIVYAPDNNIHARTYNAMLDYNSRLHAADNTIELCKPYDFVDTLTDGDHKAGHYQWAEIETDDRLYTSVGMSERGAAFAPSSPYYNVVSYPDYRARYIGAEYLGRFMLKEAPANNLAWYHAPHTEAEKYPPIDYASTRIATHPDDDSIVHQPNRIQVSAANNCFSFPFENSYSVGSSNNRIIALQSAAIEMPEMKVGELPLYAFTEEGIFALIAGSETLYARVSAINYDKIINPNTLAINGAIAYITEKGVHLLTSNGSQVISTPIHDKANRPPLDFLRTCKMIYPKEHNEIILHNEDNGDGTAYVYNIDNGYWSTRTLNGRKLNTDEMHYGGTLYDLANEDENKAMDIKIVTRPIKLGDVEFKRIESVVPRIASNDHAFSMDIDITGSVDGGDYHRLRSESLDIAPNKVNPLTIRRTPFSAKYFKMDFLLYPDPDGDTFNPSFSHIDIEWYRKLRHRMR